MAICPSGVREEIIGNVAMGVPPDSHPRRQKNDELFRASFVAKIALT
jgi:hypothetical protein